MSGEYKGAGFDHVYFSDNYLPLIHAEIARADSLHGPLPSDPVRSALILIEEAGEVAKAALGVTRTTPDETVEHLREELVQTAATAIRMLAMLEGFHERQRLKQRILDDSSKYLSDPDRNIRMMALFICGNINAAVKKE